jgi:hypothetical protein
MTDPVFTNAAAIGASSLLLQNSLRQLNIQVQQNPAAPLTKAEELFVIGTLGTLVVALVLLLAIAARCIQDLF